MSTVSSLPAPVTGAAGADPGIPFARLVHVELRKCVDTRAGRWLLAIMAVLGLGSVLALRVWGTGELRTFVSLLSGTFLPQGLLLPLVGILCVTSEFTQRTGLTSFALEPRRDRVVAAKTVAVLTLGAGLVALGALLAAVVNLTVSPVSWDVTWAQAGGLALSQAILLLWGIAFGLAFRNSPAAIVVYLVAPMVWTMVTGLVSGLTSAAEWLDLSQASNPLVTGTMTATDWAQLATAFGVWVLLPAVFGLWRVRRHEFR